MNSYLQKSPLPIQAEDFFKPVQAGICLKASNFA